MLSLNERYAAVCEQDSDIRGLLPSLRGLASKVKRVTEFGTRNGNSLTALLMGQPEVLTTYDINKSPDSVLSLQDVRGRTDLRFRQGPAFNTIAMPPIDPVGLLFVDTTHTGRHVEAELNRHGESVNHFIAFHDTTKFGNKGCGSTPERPVEGLLSGIRTWTAEHPEWRTVYQTHASNGLLVLQKSSSGVKWRP